MTDRAIHTIRGLDTRDLALIATACANRANYLTQLAAASPGNNQTAATVGRQRDRRQAAIDADRLHYIAHTLSGRRSA